MIDIVAISLVLSQVALAGPRDVLRAAQAASLRAREEAPREAREPELRREPPEPRPVGAAPAAVQQASLRTGTGGVTWPRAASRGSSFAGTPSARTGASQAAAGGGRAAASSQGRSVTASTAGGSMYTPTNTGSALPGSGGCKTYVVKFFPATTGTAYTEQALVSIPSQAQPSPLLVVFHKWGVSHLDTWVNTTFIQEAYLRGWHVIAPLSASGVHVNSQEGQQNTAVAVRWMLQNFNVDPDRIYGVGFSMGGSAVANFAARHLDPTDFMFAAILDHTGGVSNVDTYENSNANARYVFDFWYGNVGVEPVVPADPWEMVRSSVIDFDPQTLVVDATSDLARNLTHMGVKVSWVTQEPPLTAYLRTQCEVFVSHLAARGGSPVQEIVPYAGHSWDSLDEGSALQFLEPYTLQIPTGASTLADGPGRYFHFTVEQDAPQAFTPFTWNVDASQNELQVLATTNLKQIEVDLASAGLTPLSDLRVVLRPDDGLADDVVLAGWPADPTDVLRDGASQIGLGTYAFDVQAQTLTLDESDGAPHVWTVVP